MCTGFPSCTGFGVSELEPHDSDNPRHVIQTLDPRRAELIDAAMHPPDGSTGAVVSDGTNAVVHRTAVLDDGPLLLMRVAPERIGLEVGQ